MVYFLTIYYKIDDYFMEYNFKNHNRLLKKLKNILINYVKNTIWPQFLKNEFIFDISNMSFHNYYGELYDKYNFYNENIRWFVENTYIDKYIKED